MIEARITLPDHTRITQAFALAPRKTMEALNTGVRAGLAEIAKRQDDGGDSKLFRFKTPRAKRTGMLAAQFRLNTGTAIDALVANKDALFVETYSPVYYADFVASRNDFYGRILGDARSQIDAHFEKLILGVIQSLA